MYFKYNFILVRNYNSKRADIYRACNKRKLFTKKTVRWIRMWSSHRPNDTTRPAISTRLAHWRWRRNALYKSTLLTYLLTYEEQFSTGKHARIHERRRERRHNVNNQTLKRRIHRATVHCGLPEETSTSTPETHWNYDVQLHLRDKSSSTTRPFISERCTKLRHRLRLRVKRRLKTANTITQQLITNSTAVNCPCEWQYFSNHVKQMHMLHLLI